MTNERRAELAVILRGMSRARDTFYSDAQRIGHHQFLELTGLMTQMITVCQSMLTAGKDFQTEALELEDHQARYVGEKLECIWGSALQNTEVHQALLQGLGLGSGVEVEDAELRELIEREDGGWE